MAQVPSPAKPRGNLPPSAGPIAPPKVPHILEEQLHGGVPALVARHQGVPLAELRIAFALTEAEMRSPATSQVLCAALFAGTERHDRTSFAQSLEDLGGHLDAAVHNDHLVISGSVLAANAAPFLSLVCEMLNAPAYPENEVHADAARSADEALIALSQPEVIAQQELRRRLFKGHPYATGMPSPSSLRRVSQSALREAHGSLLVSSTPVVVLVGDLQPARARAMLEDSLGPWLARRKRAVGALAPLPGVQPGAIEVVARPGAVQSNLRIAGGAPSLRAPEWPAATLAESIAGGMFTSRIVSNLRERNGYTYTPYTVTRHGRAGSYIVCGADVATEVTAPALVETLYELGRLATTGVRAEELELARHHALGRFSFQVATQSGLATTMASLALLGAGTDYLTSYPKGVLAATKDAVDDAARRYLAPGRLVTVVVGDPERLQSQLSLVGQVALRKASAR
ncbi:MAG: insulinase family protein [Actinobacteria bacterium]|nr:insulinase family protein [Actinomycetota bacterium]